MRNLLFLGLVGGGLFAVGYNLMPPTRAQAGHPLRPRRLRRPGISRRRRSGGRLVPSAVGRGEAESGRRPPDLLVARRLALGLMGTVPSLEEIRQLETLPPEQRLPWWLDHILQDRRFADYFAERLARAYVGTEDGPFILYRRSRFVSWLQDRWPTTGPMTPWSAT